MRGGREGVCRGIWLGGGLNIFFSGPKCPPSYCSDLHLLDSGGSLQVNLQAPSVSIPLTVIPPRRISEISYPVLLFLGVFVSLVFLFLWISLLFLSVFGLFYRVFEGSHGERNPWYFGGFPWCFRKDQGREGQGKVGRTPKGAYSPRGRSRHLLETPFSEPFLRTLLRTLFYCKTHSKRPSQNPSENPLPEPFPEPSQNPSWNAVLPYDPLGVHPINGEIVSALFFHTFGHFSTHFRTFSDLKLFRIYPPGLFL